MHWICYFKERGLRGEWGYVMKVVMLNGQNHKGSTYHIGKEIFNKLPGDNEIKEFFFQGI